MSDDQHRLGKYQIIRTLGRGAMGVVYEGVDPLIERRVAIKTVRTADLDPDEAEEHLRRFLIEARAAGKLNHPHIVGLYDHGEHEGTTYLVMELVVGRELQQWFDDGHRFAGDDALRLMGELLDALGYSHRQGVVHRDVKPANIFITESGRLKLGDFGIARIESAQKTRAGLAIGTPTHMAPEQIRGETADARCDLYAAGVVLFQLLTGSRPFSGTMLAMALKVLNEPPPLPSSINPQVTPALDAVVTKALAKAADQRFQTAEAFCQALSEAAGHAIATPPVQALRPDTSMIGSRLDDHVDAGIGAASGTVAGAASPARLPAAVSAAPVATAKVGSRSSNRLPIWMLVGCMLAALIGTAWWLQISRPAAPPRAAAPGLAPASKQPGQPAPATGPGAARSRSTATVPQSELPQRSEARQLPANEPAAAPPAQPVAVIEPIQPPAGFPAAAARSDPGPPAAPAEPARLPGPDSREQPPVIERAARAGTTRNKVPAPPAQSGPVTPPAPLKVALPARCSDILLKASLEAPTAEESRYLREKCQ